MKILHIGHGGNEKSGKLVFDLHQNFLNEGIDSFVITKGDNNYTKSATLHSDKIIEKIKRKINKIANNVFIKNMKIDNNYYFFYSRQFDGYWFRRLLKKIPFKPDKIIIYNIQQYLSIKSIYKIYKKYNVPIFWVMYDIAPFTGGCHNVWDCDGYKNRCGNCPAIYSNKENDLSMKNWNEKKKYLGKMNITIIVGNEFMYAKAKEVSLINNLSFKKILVGFDSDLYTQGNMNLVKKELGLETDKKYIMFGAINPLERRKGFKYLHNALMNLQEGKYNIIVIGGKESSKFADIKQNIIYIDYISDRDLFIKYYQASSVVVIPSIEDSGPLMISEAMMCGTPVVSFEMGAAFDFVYNNITGYRARLKDSDDLAFGIEQIMSLDDEEYKKMAVNCRNLALEKCSKEVVMEKWKEILEYR